jgi:DNA-binding XRE family transcriptional regulator
MAQHLDRVQECLPIPRLWQPRDQAAEAAELRRIREKLGLTQDAMALALRVSPRTYGAWENSQTERGVPFAAIEAVRAWAREVQEIKRKARNDRPKKLGPQGR